MNQSLDPRQTLREWIFKKNGKIQLEDLTNETPIIEQRIISSLHIMELLLLIEQLSNKPLDISQIKEGTFRNINTIYQHFWDQS